MKRIIYQVIKSVIDHIVSILRLFLNSSIRYRLKENNRYIDEGCYILGNGPSLVTDIENQVINSEKKHIFVVNNFALSSLFNDIKPNNYVLIDPLYWFKKSELTPELFEQRETLLKAINNKTDWLLNIYIPVKVYKAGILEEYFKTNSFIKIIPFNNVNIHGGKSFKTLFYKNNLATPIKNNVLGAALYIAIFKKFKTVYILGSDHSWTKDILVNDDNEVCIADTHFYNMGSKPEPWKKFDGNNVRMYEILQSFSTMFYAYEELKMFADAMNVRIINCTKGSFIDSFERKSYT